MVTLPGSGRSEGGQGRAGHAVVLALAQVDPDEGAGAAERDGLQDAAQPQDDGVVLGAGAELGQDAGLGVGRGAGRHLDAENDERDRRKELLRILDLLKLKLKAKNLVVLTLGFH